MPYEEFSSWALTIIALWKSVPVAVGANPLVGCQGGKARLKLKAF